MAEFEEKLNAILSDPKAMGQIMSIARALGGDGGGGGGTGGAPAPDAGQDAAWEALPSAQPQNQAGGEGPPLSALGDLDPKLVQTALRLFSEYNAGDNHKTAL
ncbi:MAG: hypothetical protein GX585_05635, partial [Clostridiales bacterium]|nr:hypothetical protein [Clostridiales bacterium]